MSAFPQVAPRTRLVFAMQQVLTVVAYGWHRIVHAHERGSVTWVVGPREIASMVFHVAASIPGSHSVSLDRHKFYDLAYDSQLRAGDGSLRDSLRQVIVSPLLFARLANRARGFVYLGATGFLIDAVDQRAFEFRFLRRRGRPIVCLFTGDDIRAPRLMEELKQHSGVENLFGHYGELNDLFQSDEYDASKRRIAHVADEYAGAIINAPVDQVSYLKRPAERFRYFFPDDKFQFVPEKFDVLEPVIVVHAPSNMAVKGTPLVRDAIERLRAEGYNIDYRELVNVSNAEVRRQLAIAHIALNQFYALMPGVFGIEAMASCCAMLASADPAVETTLGSAAAGAWLITKHDQVYANIKSLLDSPESIKPLALRGFEWVKENESASVSGRALTALLDAVLDGSYRSGETWRPQDG
ncbi:MAG: glycosyltransferase family 1 protein [Microbacteriaceae bacterium]|nr:MAG: glycosyltransferase family 1 protein [Microbacteriaceae bacterium]